MFLLLKSLYSQPPTIYHLGLPLTGSLPENPKACWAFLLCSCLSELISTTPSCLLIYPLLSEGYKTFVDGDPVFAVLNSIYYSLSKQGDKNHNMDASDPLLPQFMA